MADVDFTASAGPPGVTGGQEFYAPGVSLYESTQYQFFRGNEDDLVRASVIRREWLPGVDGNSKYGVRVLLEGPEPRVLRGRKMRTRRDAEVVYIAPSGKGKCRVKKRRPVAERARLERAEKLEQQAKKVKQAREEEARMLAGLPSDPQEIRKRTFNFIVGMLGFLRDSVTNPRNMGGYAFGPEFLEELELAEDRLLDAAETCEVFLDAGERDKAIAAIKRKVADADPEFSAFMSSTLALAKASLPGAPGGD